MNVHILQHVPFEGPGMITDWCLSKGHAVSRTRFYLPAAGLPGLDTVDFLVIMGGPMGVYDEKICPWLKAEKVFISEAVRLNKRVIGICLGAQLLAACSGARVQTATRKEIGWFPVCPAEAANGHPWFRSLLDSHPVLFHWHGDRFGIPPGSENLAFTEANDNQAFLLGNRILGLQFHAEVRREDLKPMVEVGRHELRADRFIQDASSILHNPPFQEAHQVMTAILDHLALA